MPSTAAELALTPLYRHAQRSLAEWLERGQAISRRHAFRARAALAPLDAGDRHRVARWLAWLWAAELSHGQRGLGARIRYLDASLYAMVRNALAHLPSAVFAAPDEQRLTA